MACSVMPRTDNTERNCCRSFNINSERSDATRCSITVFTASMFTGTFNFAIVATCVITAIDSNVKLCSVEKSGVKFTRWLNLPCCGGDLVTSLLPTCPLQLSFTASLTVFGCFGFGFNCDCGGAVATASVDRSVCLCGLLSWSSVAVGAFYLLIFPRVCVHFIRTETNHKLSNEL